MKNLLLNLSIAAFVISALAITSCNNDDVVSPKGPNQDQTSLDWRSGNQTVSGHVELDIPNVDFPQFNVAEKYSFTAVKHQDGSVTGEFNIYDNYPDYSSILRIIAHGIVTCFTIQPDGKTAWLGGIVTNSDYVFEGVTYTYNNGTDANWIVVDNGEGNNSPSDEASDLSFGWEPGTTADNNCANGDSPNYGYGTLIRGNVKVKP
jgi:hypothetical protein